MKPTIPAADLNAIERGLLRVAAAAKYQKVMEDLAGAMEKRESGLALLTG